MSREQDEIVRWVPAGGSRRLDQALVELFPEYSRSRLQQWLKQGLITLDRRPARAKDRVFGGERVVFCQGQALAEAATGEWAAQALPLNIVYEDEALLVIDKPAGLVVHPGAGTPDGTLVNALLHHAPELEALPRAGVVHRLDKDTTGLLVVARSLAAHAELVRQLQERRFERRYQAVVVGVMSAGGVVDAPLGRHPRQRTRMAVVAGGRPARTHYRVAQRFRGHSLLDLRLETGRTHQIRVHMSHIHHPIVGDPVYGGRPRLPAGCSEGLRLALQGFRRQALHARLLGLIHPLSGEVLQWESPCPADMVALLGALREDSERQHDD